VTLSRNPQAKATDLYEKALLLESEQLDNYLNCNATGLFKKLLQEALMICMQTKTVFTRRQDENIYM